MQSDDTKMLEIEEKIELLKQGSLRKSFPDSFSEEEALQNRFGRLPLEDPPVHNITFEFTDDPVAIEQFMEVRRITYSEDILVDGELVSRDGYLADRDEFDDFSHLLVARSGHQVIGGARLTVSTPTEPFCLPLETEGFDINKAVPGINREDNIYAEWSRFSLLKPYRTGAVSLEICRHIDQRARDLGVQYIFSIAPTIQALYYRRLYKRMGRKLVINQEKSSPSNTKYGDLGFKLIVMGMNWLPADPDKIRQPKKRIPLDSMHTRAEFENA